MKDISWDSAAAIAAQIITAKQMKPATLTKVEGWSVIDGINDLTPLTVTSRGRIVAELKAQLTPKADLGLDLNGLTYD